MHFTHARNVVLVGDLIVHTKLLQATLQGCDMPHSHDSSQDMTMYIVFHVREGSKILHVLNEMGIA